MREYFEVTEQNDNIFNVAPKISDFLVDTFLYSVFPKISCSYLERVVGGYVNALVVAQPFSGFETLKNSLTIRENIADELYAFLNDLSLNIRVTESAGKLVICSDNPQYVQPLLQYGIISQIEDEEVLQECEETFKTGVNQLRINLPSQLVNALLDYTFHDIFQLQPNSRSASFLESKKQWDESWFLYNWSLELQETVDRILRSSLQGIMEDSDLNNLDVNSVQSTTFKEWRGKIVEFSTRDMKLVFQLTAHGFESIFDIRGAFNELLLSNRGKE